LQFIIGTAARYNEGAFAEWAEIESDEKLWTIPGARMKGDRPDKPHVIPLTAHSGEGDHAVRRMATT
jgi:integrase